MIRLLSWLNFTESMEPVWPSRVNKDSRVSEFQTRIERSLELVRRNLLLWDMVIDWTESLCAWVVEEILLFRDI